MAYGHPPEGPLGPSACPGSTVDLVSGTADRVLVESACPFMPTEVSPQAADVALPLFETHSDNYTRFICCITTATALSCEVVQVDT